MPYSIYKSLVVLIINENKYKNYLKYRLDSIDLTVTVL